MQQPEPRTARWALTFFPIWTGQALSLLGSQIAQFAIIWWLTQSTGSGTVLAVAALVGILPGVVLGPVAGALVDRWNRRRVMMAADGLSALLAALLAYLFWRGTVELWQIYAIMFARSVFGTFHFPAMQASTSLMVPQEQLARVAGLNQMLQGAMNIVAPPLSALLLVALPLHALMAIDVVTAALAIVPMLFVLIPQPPRPAETSAAGSVLQDVRAGLRYVRAWPGMLALLGMAMVINFLLGPAFSLLPLLVTRHFGGAALELSWLSSSWWVGILAGGVALSTWGGFRSRMLTALTALIAMGAGLLFTGLVPPQAFWAGVGALFFAGAMNSLCNGPMFALLQAVVAPEMQGRVFTLIGSLSSLMVPIGLGVAGPLSDLLGPQLWFAVGGAACVLMGAAGLLSPTIMGIERHALATTPAAAEPAS
ncbi:MAG TPA: MFS transporter [Roseiflexaceae bacterium]|nr:MFS transporter [Roseiflexaceae bacterium]